jgi:hypothetical protein
LFAGIKNKNHIRGKTKKDTRKKDEIEENVKLEKHKTNYSNTSTFTSNHRM